MPPNAREIIAGRRFAPAASAKERTGRRDPGDIAFHELRRQAFRGKAHRLGRGERYRDSQQRGEHSLREEDAAWRGAKIVSDEKRKRRKERQDEGDELGIRSGEKRQHHGAPQEQEPLRVEARRGGAGPGEPQRGKEADDPGQDSEEQHRDEVPERLVTIVFPGEKTLEMLVNEEKAEELRVGERNQYEPGRGNRQEQRGP